MIRISVVGTGYVGLVSGACLAEIGHEVICIDKDVGKIASLNAGEIPIYEPGLEKLVARNVEAGRLRFSGDLSASVRQRDAVVIAVGTPSDGTHGRADLGHVMAAAAEIGANIDRFTLVITKSTVPVGANRKVANAIARTVRRGVDFAIASNPEFLREGEAVQDFMRPDRIVVGAEDARAQALMRAIYEPLITNENRYVLTDIESAELAKYASNAFLAVKISFINEIADLCEQIGCDIASVARTMGADHRIGSAFLQTGPGWGGSCFPKDTRALDAIAQDHKVRLRLVEASIASNDLRKAGLAERISKACGGALNGKRIAILGLTFKGQTDDMRESPSLDLIPMLQAQGAIVQAYDPAAPNEAAHLLPGLTLADSPVAAATDARCLVVLTDWREFHNYDLAAMADAMADPVMVDLRNLFDAQTVLASGFRRYDSLGRSAAMAEFDLDASIAKAANA